MVSLILGGICWMVTKELCVSVAITTVVFSIYNKWVDWGKIGNLDSRISSEKLNIFRDNLVEKLIYAGNLLPKQNVKKTAVVHVLLSIEEKLNDMKNCCNDTSEHKNEIRQFKGGIGNLKTQIQICDNNDDLKTLYDNTLRVIQNIKDYVDDI